MSFHATTDMGPPRIQSVVAARSAALKIKQLSSSLFAERRKKIDLFDQGDFAVTFSDDPANPMENVLLKPKQDERQRRRRSSTITPTFARGSSGHSAEGPESHNTNLLAPGEANRRRRSTATISSGFSDPLADAELENASRQGDASPRQRRRRSTMAARPPTISIEHDRVAGAPSHNTYRLEPDKKFEHWKVTDIIKKTFEQHLIDESYDREICHHMSKTLADLIKEQVKSLQFSRYKIISIVSIGQKRGQSVRMASRSVWDPRFDGYAQYSYERGELYAIGVVYAIYLE
ncbi:uncharacterized protein LOC144637894 [Oculina patagonica]